MSKQHYPDRFKPWDTDNLSVWQFFMCGDSHDCSKHELVPIEIDENINAFIFTLEAINKAMKP